MNILLKNQIEEHLNGLKKTKELDSFFQAINKSYNSYDTKISLLDKKNIHINELSRKLQQTESELKNFAYIISHDLNAPIRGIRAIASWIIEDYGDKIDSEGQEMFEVIENRITHLHNLIDGILRYYKLISLKINKENIDLQKLVLTTANELGFNKTQKLILDIPYQLPIICNDKNSICQLFKNLLKNAIIHNDKKSIVVAVDYQEIDNHWQFSVSDNGPGIDEKHHERIFNLFQTLNAHDVVNNIGIGLTIVKRIVENNNGIIKIDSKDGIGTTFMFTIEK